MHTEEKQFVLLGLNLQELTLLAERGGLKPYRARQLFEALYRQRVSTIEEISTLPHTWQKKMNDDGWSIGQPGIQKRFVSSDGTVRYLIGFADGETVETVWMPEGDGTDVDEGDLARAGTRTRAWSRATICISSQVGCAVDCQFCLTAQLGVKRNLTAGEIVGQVLSVLKDQSVTIRKDRVNLVFMGMGEPFLNYDNFMKAVRILVEGVEIPAARMTVSTAGIVPRIHDFALEEVRPRLAISLNASNDEQRKQLMPINKKWDLEKLIGAAREFPLTRREWVTFEYVLLRNVNDTDQDARRVVELLKGIRAKVNLIALNPGPGIDFQTPLDARVLEFQRILVAAGIPTFIRRPRGRDIYAACGQLKRTVELVTLAV
ncbi:MAG TPA: 23S rRNA (adenine(2503)-C(2))-methyltransferase RlmN [Terriglobales bacterium]|jgi:23S rRNA (adenine2503-C2)-methyltransferase